MNEEYRPDPLAPHINKNGKAFNGNWKAFGPGAVFLAVGALYCIGYVLNSVFKALF
jgi:hypothetical protein